MHPNVIYSSFNWSKWITLSRWFILQIFIKDVLEINDFGDILSVQAEESTNENRELILLKKSSNIILELRWKLMQLTLKIRLHYNDLREKHQKIQIKSFNILSYKKWKDASQS